MISVVIFEFLDENLTTSFIKSSFSSDAVVEQIVDKALFIRGLQ